MFKDKPVLKYFISPLNESKLAAHVPCLSHSCFLGNDFTKIMHAYQSVNIFKNSSFHRTFLDTELFQTINYLCLLTYLGISLIKSTSYTFTGIWIILVSFISHDSEILLVLQYNLNKLSTLQLLPLQELREYLIRSKKM